MAQVVQVELGHRSYEIKVGDGLLSSAGESFLPYLTLKRVCVVTDSNVAALHLSALEKSLNAVGISYEVIVLPAGESTKSFSQLESLLNELLSFGVERNITLVAFGGGVVGDITGFAASILLRGVPFIQVPTTLLAMVDSSVGGKTGINTKYGKNLVGSFYQPKLVLADIELLDTLPERELLAGYAEVVKYGLINNVEFFAQLEKSADVALDLSEYVLQSCRAKAEIVAQDEREGGRRALLNLGHTFGHALEAEMEYDGRLLHGEGVSVGMVMAFWYSVRIGICPKEDAQRVENHLKKVGLPTRPMDITPDWDVSALLGHMKKDKKVAGGKMVFILANAIGDSFIDKDIHEDDMFNFLSEFI